MFLQIKNTASYEDGCYADVRFSTDNLARVSVIWQINRLGGFYNPQQCAGHILLEWKCDSIEQYQRLREFLLERLSEGEREVAVDNMMGQYKSNLALWIPADGNFERRDFGYLLMANLVDQGGDSVVILYDKEQGISMGSASHDQPNMDMSCSLYSVDSPIAAVSTEVNIQEKYSIG